jgi:hypothetical protein
LSFHKQNGTAVYLRGQQSNTKKTAQYGLKYGQNVKKSGDLTIF